MSTFYAQLFPSLPNIARKDITETIFGSNFKHQFNIFHITQYFWVKSYELNQWNLLNILAYISAILDDFPRWVSPFNHCYKQYMATNML